MNREIYADFHVHTHLSPCGKPEATAEAMLHRAGEKGLAAVGFSDHITPAPVPGCAFYDRQRPVLLGELRSEIARVADRPNIEILVGVEADFTMAGRECLDREMLVGADHVVCAASHFHLPAAPQPKDDGPQTVARLMLRLAREALATHGVSIWAHPFACSQMRPLGPILKYLSVSDLASLIDLALKHDVAIEINGGAARQEEYRQAMSGFMTMALEMEARFTLTADAHHPRDFERFDLAWQWSRELGLPEDRFLSVADLHEKQQRRLAGIAHERQASSQASTVDKESAS